MSEPDRSAPANGQAGTLTTWAARPEELLAAQTKVLELVARGAPLIETLTTLTRLVEQQANGAMCTVMLADPARNLLVPAAAPSLPAAVLDAISAGIPIEPGAGACGTAATVRALTIVEDIAASPLFEPWWDLARDNDLKACWSTPIIGSAAGEVLGTFAMYYHWPAAPSEVELATLAALGDLAGIAIERKRAEDLLAHQALHDPLTGAPNRLLLLERLAHAISMIERRGRAVAVLFCDLDRFKVVNDALGRRAGDELLGAVVTRLQENLRAGDTVARFGSDEFVLLVEEIESDVELVATVEQVSRAVAEPFAVGTAEVFLTCSIGVAIARTSDVDAERLLHDADIAMYQAKTGGKARFEIFDDGMRDAMLVRLDVEHSLHRAVERQELEVHYQPELRLSDGSVAGVEALVRWRHPERGLIAPDAFIGAAEETGLIIPIGAHVLREACTMAKRWDDARDGRPPMRMWVNLSARQLSQVDLPGLVAEVLRDTGLVPEQLGLELTESALMHDLSTAIEALGRLRDLGVSIAIDDFGTGYSSFSHLKRFPITCLKIDRSFLEGLGEQAEDTAIVGSIIGLAHMLGLDAIAEGVETQVQLDELRDLGCDLAQGWLFAKAQPADQIEQMLPRPDSSHV